MTKELSKKIITKLSAFYGKVKPDLRYNNIFQLTIAVVLSAQTTDKQVNSVTPKLFNLYPDFHSLSNADIKDIKNIIKSTGFYNNKAKNIIDLSKNIIKSYKGKVPKKLDELIQLSGIGRKSANVILSIGYGIPALAVDTHVMRISNRLGYIISDNPLHIENALISIIPETDWINTHMLFIKHGRITCNARNPLCHECPVSDSCCYNNS